jgi:anti-sigma factor RsiW
MTGNSICRRVRRWLPLWVGGDLTGESAQLAELHVRTCPRCAALHTSFRGSRTALRSLLPQPEEDGWTELAWKGDPPRFPARRQPPRRGRLRGAAAVLLLLGATCAAALLSHPRRGPSPSPEKAADVQRDATPEPIRIASTEAAPGISHPGAGGAAPAALWSDGTSEDVSSPMTTSSGGSGDVPGSNP